jgi:hypothetical protein
MREDREAMFEVVGVNKKGAEVFRTVVNAPNESVAKLYATARLSRNPDGAVAVINAAKVTAQLKRRA